MGRSRSIASLIKRWETSKQTFPKIHPEVDLFVNPCVSGRSVHAAGPAFAHYALTPVSVTSTCFAFSNL